MLISAFSSFLEVLDLNRCCFLSLSCRRTKRRRRMKKMRKSCRRCHCCCRLKTHWSRRCCLMMSHWRSRLNRCCCRSGLLPWEQVAEQKLRTGADKTELRGEAGGPILNLFPLHGLGSYSGVASQRGDKETTLTVLDAAAKTTQCLQWWLARHIILIFKHLSKTSGAGTGTKLATWKHFVKCQFI